MADRQDQQPRRRDVFSAWQASTRNRGQAGFSVTLALVVIVALILLVLVWF